MNMKKIQILIALMALSFAAWGQAERVKTVETPDSASLVVFDTTGNNISATNVQTAIEELSNINYGRILYVSKSQGNNTIAEPGNPEKPWIDPWSARDSAVSGDVIYVFGKNRYTRGTDFTSGNLWKDGVSYFFEHGNTIDVNNPGNVAFLIDPTNDNENCNIYGHLRIERAQYFNLTFDRACSAEIELQYIGGTGYFFEVDTSNLSLSIDSATSSLRPLLRFRNLSGNNIEARINYSNINAFSGTSDFGLIQSGANTLAENSNVYVKIKNHAGNSAIFTHSGPNKVEGCNFYISADNIFNSYSGTESATLFRSSYGVTDTLINSNIYIAANNSKTRKPIYIDQFASATPYFKNSEITMFCNSCETDKTKFLFLDGFDLNGSTFLISGNYDGAGNVNDIVVDSMIISGVFEGDFIGASGVVFSVDAYKKNGDISSSNVKFRKYDEYGYKPQHSATFYQSTIRQYTFPTPATVDTITIDTLSNALITASIAQDTGYIRNISSDTVRWSVSYSLFRDSDEDPLTTFIDITTDGTDDPEAIEGSRAYSEQTVAQGVQHAGQTFTVDVPPGDAIRLCTYGSGVAAGVAVSDLTISVTEIYRK